jgi:MFS family permease
MSLIFWIVSQRSGKWASRFGARTLMTLGMALMGVGLLLLGLVSASTSLLEIEVALFIAGIGLGLNAGPVVSVAVASVPASRSGTASGLVNTARMVGATLGVAILGAVFAQHAKSGDGAGFIAGLRAAFLIGGGGEMLGALVAFCAIRRDALDKSA